MSSIATKNSKFYPSFSKQVIDPCREISDCPHWLVSFQFRSRSKRKDDIVALSSFAPRSIVYFEHPDNRDSDDGASEDEFNVWRTLVLHSLRLPTSCISVDVNGSGFNDLIVTYDYGDSLSSPDVFGGRVCWLENYGTNEDDWGCHEIGRFPGVNMIRVGHFTTTFSLQVLAIVKSPKAESNAPLVIFTKPDDVYNSSKWHINIVLEPEFSAIQDVMVVKSSSSNLDYIVISCQEGLVVTWYAERTWHTHSLLPLSSPSSTTGAHHIGQIRTLRSRQEPIAYIIFTEVDSGILTLCTKSQVTSRSMTFPDIEWTQCVLMDFNDNAYNALILDLICADFDGDGMDEILVSVDSPGRRSGIYFFDFEDGHFVRYRLSPDPVSHLTVGHFERRNKLDFASLSLSSPREIAVHYRSFISSHIKPFIEGSELVFSVPRHSPSICEADVIDVAGYVLSLVVLPPDAAYQVSSDGVDAVKVLHGSVGWMDSQDRLVERTPAYGEPGCAYSMLVDCGEGTVRSGNDGAVFVRLKPSKATDNSILRAFNVLPSYFPCDVCEYEFHWEAVHDKPWIARSINSINAMRIQHLSGFRIKFEGEAMDFGYVHFWASEGNVSTGFSRQASSPWMHSGASDQEICSIRACLSNPGGDGGVEYCDDTLDWGAAIPTRFQLSRAKKAAIPVLYEQGPLWRIRTGGPGQEVVVEYPWHAWVGRGDRTGRWNVWATFEFPLITPQHLDNRACIIA